ncbi:hypothetical protein A9A89_1457 [Bifidobacterium psychraerophilum DSM 22366]|uniref:Uncharacterized protein n=1 Tax=Bifidobacterium psychraerophilum TaxID=218140 RepID=A0A087CGK7_9BIFI|nr:hypothetical protein BPSY_1258 [Bifidobacterium psychraerophilum]PKA95209.1 hypothetical protein A9A89_1457 [Bifidobacterium psychraerophilum DSM 22366]
MASVNGGSPDSEHECEASHKAVIARIADFAVLERAVMAAQRWSSGFHLIFWDSDMGIDVRAECSTGAEAWHSAVCR